jgi:hypothetical protein
VRKKFFLAAICVFALGAGFAVASAALRAGRDEGFVGGYIAAAGRTVNRWIADYSAMKADAAGEKWKVSKSKKIVTAHGIGKIAAQNAVSRGKARRAALTDARRNLLLEAKRIRTGDRSETGVSGYVKSHWIVAEKRDGSFYRVTLAANLDYLFVD